MAMDLAWAGIIQKLMTNLPYSPQFILHGMIVIYVTSHQKLFLIVLWRTSALPVKVASVNLTAILFIIIVSYLCTMAMWAALLNLSGISVIPYPTTFMIG